MKATNIAAQLANEVSVDARDADATDKEIRLLQDLEMVLVGGGSDPIVIWN